MSLTKNIRCMSVRPGMTLEEILNACTLERHTYTLDQCIGKGTFGKVFRAFVEENNQKAKVAIKFMFNIDNYNILDESEFAYFMSINDIGPKVYKRFFYNLNDTLNMVIIMESFDGNVEEALASKSFSLDRKKETIKQTIHILHKQFNSGLLCFDIKLNNFVIKILKKNNKIKVRAIDFGKEYCSFQPNILRWPLNIRTSIFASFLLILYFQSARALIYSITKDENKIPTRKDWEDSLNVLDIYYKLHEQNLFPNIENIDSINTIVHILNDSRFHILNQIFSWYIYGEYNKEYKVEDIKNILLLNIITNDDFSNEMLNKFHNFKQQEELNANKRQKREK